MDRQILHLLPESFLRIAPGVAGACAIAGIILWICGARYSRSILSLVAVAVGTFIGMRLPAWRGWQIDGMGTAVGGAVVFGAGAFLFHRTMVGLLLGGVMTLWAGVGVWIFMARDGKWDLSALHWEGDAVQFLRQAWQGLPKEVSPAFPIACFVALAGGITIAVFLPKLARVLAHSFTGMTLIAVMGLLALEKANPEMLKKLPGSSAAQGLMLIGFVLAGAIVQWQITPPFKDAGSKAVRK